MAQKKGQKASWPVVAARIPPELRQQILQRHPGNGCISNLIYILLKKYMENKIFGIKIETIQ
jgi:hypothetical protein